MEPILLHADICGKLVRSTHEPCLLNPNHKGHHSRVVFTCDSCSRIVRGVPYKRTTDRWENDLAFCFYCVKESERE